MRAAVITKYNEPWELKEMPDPRPGPGQVLVRIHASGMCGTDLHAHHGHMGGTLPMVPGHEPAGEIVALGEGVLDLKVGDRVGAFWNQKGCGRCASCQSGLPGRCPTAQSWIHIGGSHAELMLAWASGCALIPDGLAYELAAPIFCGGYTVMSGLRNGDPRPGERIAVLGMGGLGHLALQLAKAVGLETVAVTGQADKRAELVAMGADEVVVAGDDPGAGAARRRRRRRDPVDHQLGQADRGGAGRPAPAGAPREHGRRRWPPGDRGPHAVGTPAARQHPGRARRSLRGAAADRRRQGHPRKSSSTPSPA